MHIAPLPPGLPPVLRAGTDPALATAGERDSRDRPRPPVARVFEGEVVPRPRPPALPADAAGRTPLAAAGTASAPDVILPSRTSAKMLFYLLHSSDAALGATALGGRIDQLA